MANLTALHFENGAWDVFVIEGLVRSELGRRFVESDVLGRKLPAYTQLQAISLVKPSEAKRLANHRKGLSREKRQQVYQDWAKGASQIWMNK